MGREVLLNGKQLDVMIDDNLEITYENPALQSVSDFKMSYTNTFTLPLTDKNKAIFDAIDNVNAGTSIARKYGSLYEYRDGIPVIEDARVRIKTIKPRDTQIDIEVIWGALKSISDEIGKGNINDLPGEILTWPTSNTFISPTDNVRLGWLYFDTVKNLPTGSTEQSNIANHLPSCRADIILEKIFDQVTTSYILSDAFKIEIQKLWVPCLTKNSNIPSGDVPITNIMKGSSSGSIYTVGLYHSKLTEIASASFGSFRPIPYQSTYSFMYLNTNNTYNVSVDVDMTIPAAVTGDVIEFTFWIRESQLSYAWHIGTHNITLISGTVSGMTWDNTTKKLTGTFMGSNSLSIDVEADVQPMILDVITLKHNDISTVLAQGIGPNNATINNTYTYWLTNEVILGPGNKIDAIYNLPKVSQMDFIKNLLALTGSYVYFDNGTIKFDSIDNILDADALNIESWITTKEPKSIEISYDDYAQINRYNYAEDDNVNRNGNGVIVIEDDTLDAEKEVILLKFSATDSIRNSAFIPIFEYTDKVNYIGSSLKPRIINTYNSPILKIGNFDSEMDWSTILENKYKLFKSILSDIRVVEVEMYMQMTDLYLLNTNKLYYFWGAKWIMIDITVSTDGGATGKFIMIN